ncbi:MAG: class I SAM-dependent methyltransferase [Spirochaetia bacterium]|jgi:ubiquinone/menaquinone biosynthesis C-methylase UbiE
MKNGMVDFLSALPLTDAQQIMQRVFDAIAPSYDNAIVRLVESLSCPWRTYTARMESFMASAGGKVILDVGCGTAFPIGSFIPQTSIYLGMDISLEMLGHAKILLGENLNASLWNIDAERIPLPDTCIDLSLVLMSFNVFPNPHKAATEIHRVLKKDGAVYGTVFTQAPPEEITSERPIEPGLVKEILSVFDPALWELSFENQGGILFFHVQQNVR